MDIEDTGELEQGAVPVLGQDDEQPENLLEQLAAKREIVSETKEVHIPVPGYEGDPPILLIGYRLLDGPDIDRIVSVVRAEFRNRWERGLFAAVDTFIAATTGMFVDEGDGNPKPLTISKVPITGFTAELARALKFDDKIEDPNRPRDVVFGLFGKNEIAISQHNYLLNRWFGDTSLKVSRELFEGNL